MQPYLTNTDMIQSSATLKKRKDASSFNYWAWGKTDTLYLSDQTLQFWLGRMKHTPAVSPLFGDVSRRV